MRWPMFKPSKDMLMDEVANLKSEVGRLNDFIRHVSKVNAKMHGDMVEVAKAEVVRAHNDAIEAAAQEIDCGGHCGACGSHGHCYIEMADTIRALKK